MKFILVHSDHSSAHQRQLRHWYYDNGLLFSDLTGPGVVDTVAQTVTVWECVAVDGQETFDFPEWVYGSDDRPVAVERVVPLRVMPLAWMLNMTGAWTAPYGSDSFAA